MHRYILQVCIFNAATGNNWIDLCRFGETELKDGKVMCRRLSANGKIVRVVDVIVDTEE